MKTKQKLLTSVGIDIGSSTSHIIFSELLLEKDPYSRTEKFEIKERKIIHSGPIHLTPFRDERNIDFDTLKNLILADYEEAGFDIKDIDTGAVIITGETAKKQNADEIVNAVAGEAGKFVAATAGPNYESVLAAHGSGAVTRSEETGRTIMNVDVGGGSSNIAVCSGGRIVATAAINVGGRLLAYDKNERIYRMEEPGHRVAKSIGYDVKPGDLLDSEMREKIANALAQSLIAAIADEPQTTIGKSLMMTSNLGCELTIDELTFSGGVAEYIYDCEKKSYNDLGPELATSIRNLVKENSLPLTQPDHRIRATVIGAGHSTLQVSGSTTFLSSGLRYPIRDLPAVVPFVPRQTKSSTEIAKPIREAIKRLDLEEGVDSFILGFRDAVRPSYENLTLFSKGIVEALEKTVKTGRTIFLCFDTDIGNSVGNVMKRETGITNEVLSIDEVALSDGDYVDIGEPIIEGVVVPVIIKTLVFDRE